MRPALAASLLLLPLCAVAGPKWTDDHGDEVELVQRIQLWGTYSYDLEAGPPLRPIDNRWDLFVRRGRVGTRGVFFKTINYKIEFQYDGIGKDNNDAIRAANNAGFQIFSLYEAYWTWAALPSWFNVTGGFFRPQVGRESVTSDFGVDSFEKALTQTYVRLHQTGRSSGREAGVNFGGLWNGSRIGVNYDFGIWDPDDPLIAGKQKRRWWPLLTGRAALSLGEPEHEKYSLVYQTVRFGERRGVTIGANGSFQGPTDVFERNWIVGGDVLANWGGLTASLEHDWLGRKWKGETAIARVWHARLGYAIPFRADHFIGPTVLFSQYVPGKGSDFNGWDQTVEADLNWFLRKQDLRLTLAWSHGWGSAVSGFTDGTSFRRGDYIGLGVQFVY